MPRDRRELQQRIRTCVFGVNSIDHELHITMGKDIYLKQSSQLGNHER